MLVADERGSKREYMPVAFVAEGQAPVSDEPGECAFDLLAMKTQAGGVIDAAADDTRDDGPTAWPVPADTVAVARVGAPVVRPRRREPD